MAASLSAPFVPLVLPTEQRGTERQPPYQDVPIASALAQLILLSRVVFFFISSPKHMLIAFGGWGDGEKHQYERETDWLPPIRTPTGDCTRNASICPTWKWTRNPLVLGTTPNPLSHTGQG